MEKNIPETPSKEGIETTEMWDFERDKNLPHVLSIDPADKRGIVNYLQVLGEGQPISASTLSYTTQKYESNIEMHRPYKDIIRFDFDDIQLIPEPTTDIDSRSEIDEMVYDTAAHSDNVLVNYLPLISSPMDTLLSIKGKDSWNPAYELKLEENDIRVCYPRGCDYASNDEHFSSFSLTEFKKYLEVYKHERVFANDRTFILIDMANGHMRSLLEAIREAKANYPELSLMVGNVGHPEAYMQLSNAGADYVRVGIGNGAGCLTTQQTGIGYPMASLIEECYNLSKIMDNPAKIVADGGFKKYSDIIKAISLGADYVMLGSILNKTLESDSKPYAWGWLPMPNLSVAKWFYNKKIPLYKKFRGMSTKEVQKIWGNGKLKTSEGVTRYQKVEYTTEGWVENFTSYLKSAMSYQNCKTMDEFRGSAAYIKITPAAHNRFKK